MDITQFIVTRRDEALLLGDHNTYRTQLSRRIATLRRRLGRSTPKNAKFSIKERIIAEDIGKNHEFLHLQILVAERAWAHAMYLKSARAEENAGKGITGSTRNEIISRLHKAAYHASELLEALSNKSASTASNTDLLEAQAYHLWLTASEEFEKQSSGVHSKDAQAQKERWEACLRDFCAARVIYNAFLQNTRKDLFKEVLASGIDPSIRYAAYQSRLPRTLAIATVAKKYFPKDDADLVAAVERLDQNALTEETKTPSGKAQSAVSVPDTITWRSRTANIVDAAIGQALVAVNAAEAKLSGFLSEKGEISQKDKAAAYDDVLIASQDAADASRHAVEELEKEGVDEGDARMQDLRVTILAVNYDLIGWRIGRNRVLIGQDNGLRPEGEKRKPRKDGTEWSEKEEGTGRKLARFKERAALYDAILQSIDSIKELRGAVRDAAFVKELDGKRAYFQALKCLNIGYSHAALSAPLNALALFVRAETLATKATSAAKSSVDGPPKLDISTNQAEALRSNAQGLISQYRALVELQHLSDQAATAAQKNAGSAAPLVERLNEYPANGVDLKNLVTYPPKLQPVPVKPLFLDTAWNYIEYPGQGAKPAPAPAETAPEVNGKPEQRPETKPKKSWFGFGR